MVAELEGAQRKVVGLKQLLRELHKDNITKVYLAEDADQELKKKVLDAAHGKNVAIESIEKMKDLGDICKIDVQTACAGILKESKEKPPSLGLHEKA
jgi:large subunit ribosomal protein L7A